MPDLSIVTPWLDHPEFIEDYENAVRAADVQVIVVDNGSSSANASLLQQMAGRLNGTCIRNEENRWFSAANNQGLALAAGRIVLFLNNDIAAPGGWLDGVRRDVDDAALFGPMIRQEQVNQTTLDYIEGSCIAGARAAWAKLGGWNERAFQMNHCEDVELCHRAVAAGLALRKTDWPLHHKGNGTGPMVPGNVDGALHNRQVLARLLRGEQVATAPSLAPQRPEKYLKSGRLLEGERAYCLALQFQPARADYWMDYGAILRAAGRFEAAVDAFTHALECDNRLDLRARNEIAATYSAAQDHPRAIEAFTELVQRMPGSVEALCNLAAAQTCGKLWNAAIATAEQALQLDPNSAIAHVRLADALIAKGDFSAAISQANSALRLDPRNVTAWCVIGAAFRSMGQSQQSLDAYNHALAIDPQNMTLHYIRDSLARRL